MESLEEYLSGALSEAGRRKIELHLNACVSCREDVIGMQDISLLFEGLKPPKEVVAPSPGFYARVLRQVGTPAAVPSFWSLFSLDFAFGRRLALASLLSLAVLGGILVTRESEYPNGPTAVMAEQNSPFFDSAPAQDSMLVTLASYEH